MRGNSAMSYVRYFDIVFTGFWSSNFWNKVQLGALLSDPEQSCVFFVKLDDVQGKQGNPDQTHNSQLLSPYNGA